MNEKLKKFLIEKKLINEKIQNLKDNCDHSKYEPLTNRFRREVLCSNCYDHIGKKCRSPNHICCEWEEPIDYHSKCKHCDLLWED